MEMLNENVNHDSPKNEKRKDIDGNDNDNKYYIKNNKN